MPTQVEEYSQLSLSEEEKDKLVAEVVRYVLFKSHQSSGCPIKREELVQIVTKNYRQRSLPALIIGAAQQKLSSVFGFELRELCRSRFSSSRNSQGGSADSKSYVLISKLPSDVYREHVEDPISSHLSGFAFVVIGLVNCTGGTIPEEQLFHHLKRMGLSEGDETYPVLGNAKQALDLLVQQRYLHSYKTNGPEGSTVFYELAERSLDEPINLKVKECIGQIVKKDDPHA